MRSKWFLKMLLALPLFSCAEASENAGIYSTKEIPALKPLLASLVPGAAITNGTDGGMDNFTCAWPAVSVKMTVDTRWDREVQVAGIKGWIGRFPPDKTTPAVRAMVRKLETAKCCIGCVITPGYDADGKVISLLLGLAKALNGYVFTHQSFYDVTGAKVVGFPDDPVTLKPAK